MGREKEGIFMRGDGGAYSSVLGLGNPEVDDEGLDAAPDGEDDVCSPADLVH